MEDFGSERDAELLMEQVEEQVCETCGVKREAGEWCFNCGGTRITTLEEF